MYEGGSSVLWCHSLIHEYHDHYKLSFLVHLRLKCTIVIMRCPSSVLSPSSLTFHIFDFSETTERNSTKLDRKQDLNVLYQVCVFCADRKSKMAAVASDWLRHFLLLLWNRWTEFNETWQEARSQHPLPSLRFSGRSEKQDGRPGLWLAETFSTSPLKPLNGIQRNLTGSKISTSSIKFLGHRSQRLQCTIVITRCPASVRRPSVVRPSSVKLFTFSTSSPEPLDGFWWNLVWMKYSRSLTSVVVFRPDPSRGGSRAGQKLVTGGPLLQETSSSDRKATATNRMHSSDL